MLSSDKLEKERNRLYDLSKFEREYDNFIIGGIDEAGRGPLAGPVVASCVVLDKNIEILYINDSKKLSEKKRDVLYDEIIDKCLAYGIGVVSEKIIDEINILEATHKAMFIAYKSANKMLNDRIGKNIDCLFVDALRIKNIDIKQVPIMHGDRLSISIAASSIIAKVYRDNLMKEYDKIFPAYNFLSNKGYGTKEHMEILRKVGPSEIHRQSFLGFLNDK